MSSRNLNAREIATARTVFRETIPYDSIRILNSAGIGGAAFTIPEPLRKRQYRLYMGQNFTDDMSLLIHELTHVWQSYNNGSAWAYALDSMFSQATHGRQGAYLYEAGLEWRQYNVEQQAKIVEDWFSNGSKQTDKRYRYIRDSIWHPEKREGFSYQDFSNILK